ncbi:hypothetical protein [Streptomyces sp. MMBL 11-3]|uniref:hypothetical protein n=1 Tax=Streptomyces sp. MMBL 11-3 TaxID=3382639 RepID=UPI0039B601BE
MKHIEHRAPPPVEQRAVSPRRPLLVATAAALVSLLLAASYEYATHAPSLRGISVEVVGGTSRVDAVSQRLSSTAPGSFTVERVPSASAATARVADNCVDAALILSASVSAADRIVVAGASGPTMVRAIVSALSSALPDTGPEPVVTDVAALSRNDQAGMSSFVFELGLLVPSVLGSVGLYLVGLRARLWWRVAGATLYAALAALLGVLLLDAGFGALTGAPFEMFGIFAEALTFVLIVAALQASLGLPGTGLAALILLFVGNAASGGTTPPAMLPDFYRQISEWLPNSAVVRATKAAVYFEGHGIGQPLAALALWSGAAMGVLIANDRLHLSERRRSPHDYLVIHATPGVAHLARRRRRSRHTPESETLAPRHSPTPERNGAQS